MRILIDIQHPAHIHFFKNAARILEQKGYTIIWTGRNKDIVVDLAREYKLPMRVFGTAKKGVLNLGLELVYRQAILWRIARKEKPDCMIAIAGTFISFVGKMLRIPTHVFCDSEFATVSHWLSFPFATHIYVPECYEKQLPWKHTKYRGSHDLAYLHPKRFTPDARVLTSLGLRKDETFFVMRFVSWEAGHDIGQHGFTIEGKHRMVDLLKKHGRVIISSEAPLPREFEPYRMSLCPTKIHDLLYYSKMYIGDGGTMTTEAAVLGTPAVLVTTLTAGVFRDFEETYDLMYLFKDESLAIKKVEDLLQQHDLKAEWRAKRLKMLQNKIDVTQFIVDILTKSSPACH